jgi:hypothetical protein
MCSLSQHDDLRTAGGCRLFRSAWRPPAWRLTRRRPQRQQREASMSTWVVLTIFGLVAVTWGPVPYDYSDCLDRVATDNLKLDDAFRSGELATIDGRQAIRADVVLSCVDAPPLRPIRLTGR